MSDARAVLALLGEHGVTATLIGGRVKLVGGGKLSPAVLTAARAVRDDIAALLAKPFAKAVHSCYACGVTTAFKDDWSVHGAGGARRCCAKFRLQVAWASLYLSAINLDRHCDLRICEQAG